jgi:hypothetical protein
LLCLGKNKQSVPDCERIISPGVFKFLEKKGHTSGATVLKLLHNWHKAVDGRGLSEDQRSTYCEELKCWLLDDWMPWHREVKDYSQIDVNRLALLAASFVFLVKIKHVFPTGLFCNTI